MERRLAAILAADLVGYSRLVRADEEGTLTAFRALRAGLIDPQLRAHHGRIVKLMGDGMLVAFASVVDAVRAAVAIQTALHAHNADLPAERRMEFRIGINLGDVIIDGDDIQGDGVNLAARLEGIAAQGGLCIADAVHEQVRDRLDLTFADAGTEQLKNIDRPVRVWRWAPGDVDPPLPAPVPAPPVDRPSVAVLPFDNRSGDPEQAYFADGITEDIITGIASLPGLMVISRNSSFTYRGMPAKVQDVCRDLGVRYVLEGSVRKAGQRVRITAQLIDGNTGGHLWAERYDRGLADVFAVQDDVTAQIVQALQVRLTGEPEASAPTRDGTENPEAYDCVLRGREQYRLFSRDGNRAARHLFERAIALDPAYASPYAGLAETYVQDWFVGTEGALERAFELARAAQARAPSLPLVQEALSTVHLFRREHAEAIATAERWIEVEPSNADAYAALAGARFFAGEPNLALPAVAKAMRLDPFYPAYLLLYEGQALFSLARFDEAADAIGRSIIRNPDLLPAHIFLAACHGHRGDGAGAENALADVRRIDPGFSLQRLKGYMPFRLDSDLARLVAGLKSAGLAA